MQTSNEHAVNVLNDLIKTTLDSVGGYKEAEENADQPQLKSLFAQNLQKREQLASQLQNEVRALGGDPQTNQGILGMAHNKFVDIKNAVTGGGSDKSIVEEVERGEDHIKEKFEKVASDSELPPSVRNIVLTACQSIKADHDQVSQLKRTMH